MIYDLQFHVRTLDGDTLISDVEQWELDENDDVDDVLSEIMQELLNSQRIYVSFKCQGRRTYFNPENIVSVTPWYEKVLTPTRLTG